MILSATYTDMPGQKGPIIYRGEMEECFPLIRQDGFDGVEMHIHDSDRADRDMIGQAISKNGLALTSIGTGSAYSRDGLSLTSTDRAIRRAAVERIRGHIRLSSLFPGARVILGLIRGKISEAPGPEVYYELLSESLRDCASYAQDMGVTLVLEMIGRRECDALNTIAEGSAYLKALGLPALKLHIDTYHMSMEEADAPSAIREAGSLIGHVHVADDDRQYPGHGHYDFPSVLNALRDISYQGALAVEALSLPDMRTAGQKSAAFLRAL